MNFYQGVFCHAWSIMQIVDDFGNQDRANMLRFVDFFEALARLAEMKTMPTAMQLRAAQVSDIVEYVNYSTILHNYIQCRSRYFTCTRVH